MRQTHPPRPGGGLILIIHAAAIVLAAPAGHLSTWLSSEVAATKGEVAVAHTVLAAAAAVAGLVSVAWQFIGLTVPDAVPVWQRALAQASGVFIGLFCLVVVLIGGALTMGSLINAIGNVVGGMLLALTLICMIIGLRDRASPGGGRWACLLAAGSSATIVSFYCPWWLLGTGLFIRHVSGA